MVDDQDEDEGHGVVDAYHHDSDEEDVPAINLSQRGSTTDRLGQLERLEARENKAKAGMSQKQRLMARVKPGVEAWRRRGPT